MIPKILETMVLETAGSCGGLLVGNDGMAVHWLVVDEVVDAEECAAWTSTLLEQACLMMAGSLGGPPEQITIQAKDLSYLIRRVGSEYLLAMLLEPGSNLEAASVNLRRYAAELAGELNCPVPPSVVELGSRPAPAG